MQEQSTDGTDRDDISTLYQEQTMIALGIYSFLDNLLSALRSRRRTTENEIIFVHDETPAPPQTDLKPGGYPEEMFVYLSENDKEKYECSVCYNILKDAHQCRNKHRFCYSCIYVWSSTPGGGSDRCPMCREDGLYARNAEINENINRKRVKCLNNSECNWRGYLRDYENHVHRQYTTSEINEHLQLPNIQVNQRSTVKSSTKVPLQQVRRISDISVGQASEAVSTSEFIHQNDLLSTNLSAQSPSSIGDITQPLPVAAHNQTQASAEINNSTSNGNNRTQVQTRHVPLRRGSIRPRHIAGNATNTGTGNNRIRTNLATTVPRRNSVSRNNISPATVSSPSSLTDDQSNLNTLSHENSISIVTESTGSPGTTSFATIPRPPATPRPKNQRPRLLTNQRTAATSALDNSSTNNSNNASFIPQVSVEPENHEVDVSASSGTVDAQETTPQVELEYVRLREPPTRPPNVVSQRLREGREQLGLLMSLFSLQLNERQQAIDRYQLHHREREQRRLQQLYEVQTLNRRLTQVASNLGSLIDRDPNRNNNAEQSSDETSDTN